MIEVSEEIGRAVTCDQAIVALETTLICHGLPSPTNLETALEMESVVRSAGAIPATIGILDGRVKVGLTETEIERLATSDSVIKCSTRDIARTIVAKRLGATTVASTIFVAHRVGIRFMATGGIGGVHRGGQRSFDISADIAELARTPVTVVCSGPKAILDIDLTAEALESAGISIVGYETDRLPGFYVAETAISIPRIDGIAEAALLVCEHAKIEIPGAIIIANPPPADLALSAGEFAKLLTDAERSSIGVSGGDVTPFLLAEIARHSRGRSIGLNRALVVANAALAAHIATSAVGPDGNDLLQQ